MKNDNKKNSNNIITRLKKIAPLDFHSDFFVFCFYLVSFPIDTFAYVFIAHAVILYKPNTMMPKIKFQPNTKKRNEKEQKKRTISTKNDIFDNTISKNSTTRNWKHCMHQENPSREHFYSFHIYLCPVFLCFFSRISNFIMIDMSSFCMCVQLWNVSPVEILFASQPITSDNAKNETFCYFRLFPK